MKILEFLKQEHVISNFYGSDIISGKILEAFVPMLDLCDELKGKNITVIDDSEDAKTCVVKNDIEFNSNDIKLFGIWKQELVDKSADGDNFVFIIRGQF